MNRRKEGDRHISLPVLHIENLPVLWKFKGFIYKVIANLLHIKGKSLFDAVFYFPHACRDGSTIPSGSIAKGRGFTARGVSHGHDSAWVIMVGGGVKEHRVQVNGI